MKRFKWLTSALMAVGVLAMLATVAPLLQMDALGVSRVAVSRFAEIPNLFALNDLGARSMKIDGRLRAVARHADGSVFATVQKHNNIPNTGETALRDCFGGTGTPSCTPVMAFKYHGLGTSGTAVAETDTGCGTELTTQYNPDSTRATGSQTNNGANVYRTVGTNTVDASAAVQEFCLMSQASTAGGTVWSRVTFTTINLSSADSLQTTYDLTIE